LYQSGAKLIITVDCGIAASKEITQAKKLGLDIIVTDHHNPPSKLPTDAVALINPKLSSRYPFKELAGVGVAFKLICAMQQKMPEKMSLGREKWLLDLVALGTICDAVDLVDENRVLAKYGLVVIRKTARIGIRALVKAANLDLHQLESQTLGFVLGPRLNAAGRLEHANAALELLLTTDFDQATKIAQDLNQLNLKRQDSTQEISLQALRQASEYANDQVLVLADPNWSHGIAGIVANRLSERLNKPTIILQIEDDYAKGSGRSRENFSLIKALKATKRHLVQYGGHHFAAGLKLKTKDLSAFRKAINNYAKKCLAIKPTLDLEIDLILDNRLINFSSLEQLSKLEPFGKGNPEPHFLSRLKLLKFRPVGRENRHLKLTFSSANGNLEAIAFNAANKFSGLKPSCHFLVVYKLKANNFQNIKDIQLEVVDFGLPDAHNISNKPTLSLFEVGF